MSLIQSGNQEVNFILFLKDDIHIYPGYDSRRIAGDFALLYLSSGSNKPTPVLNPNIIVPAEKDTIWISGRGETYTDDDYPNYSSVPREKSLEVARRDACELTYADFSNNEITNAMLGATGWGEGSCCQGDSVGPAALMKDLNGDHLKDVLVGVVSWGAIGCNYANRCTVLSRVSEALSWFLSMMPSAMELRLAPAPAPFRSYSTSPTKSPITIPF